KLLSPLTGYSGGTAIIYCHYYRGEEHYGKYFCMGQNSLSCEEKIRSGSQNTWEHSGRFSLYDKTVVNYFTVVIRQLTRQDEGTYWCGVGEPVVPDSYTKVELEPPLVPINYIHDCNSVLIEKSTGTNNMKKYKIE
uniref:Immunoglobulin V-set domain-containing protein n=1 Tax=Esox lucius TaxID=8010 RepID=A0AAY5KQG5_ESOLU